ncbi:hypothetical protein DL89DRAFT_255500 [Linderina pennispora]|uniref:CoA-dependent acyltransferase n=1 Tax=Linderina pennispora TaxID=61395 RepID=A0A1Y1WIT2_9FUNG|nr:uncharacterized protein DL89DRAFT_255500 [Linderina pennispora]ORX73403.1 hypothetical protein DL89DRAFT_255500 [Linderina pennispora]
MQPLGRQQIVEGSDHIKQCTISDDIILADCYEYDYTLWMLATSKLGRTISFDPLGISIGDNIESKEYICRRYEKQFSHITIRFVFFYANTAGAGDFMPADQLEEGFYRTLALCPWFAGELKQTPSGGMEVIVDEEKLNMPYYRESQSLVHFSKIQSSGFHRMTWPDNLVPVGPVAYPDKATGMIKLLHIQVVRLKENSGVAISVNFNHGVADDETRALVSGVPVAEASFCFGGDIIKRHLPTERAPLSEPSCKVLSAKSHVADFFMWLSLNKRGMLASYLVNSASPRGHLFRISRSKIDRLRSQVLEHLPHETRLSTNDIISAALHRVHEQAVIGKSRGWLDRLTGWKNGVAGEHCTAVVVNYRRQLGMSELNYMGNPIFSEFVLTPMHQANLPITPKTISEVAGQIRSQVSALTIPRIGQNIDVFDSGEKYAADFFVIGMTHKLMTITTNITSAKMYSADFGHGVQAFSTIHPELAMGIFLILPSPPSKQGHSCQYL